MEGLAEVGKKFNYLKGRDFKVSVRRIQRHHIFVAGSFIMGLDTDERGIGKRIADAGSRYGVDLLNVPFLTPLPGTRLWDRMESQGRIAANRFPEDWKYYTFSFPVARYKHLSWEEILEEMDSCYSNFCCLSRILRRTWENFWRRRKPVLTLVSDLSYRKNFGLHHKACREFKLSHGQAQMNARGLLANGVSETPKVVSCFPSE